MSDSDKLLEATLDLVNAVESACVNFKRYVVKEKGLEEKPSWDPSKIKWMQAEGSKGPYEKASAEETSVSLDFAALLEDLKAHGGKLQRSGWFYWRFDKATTTTVGRKKH